MTKERPILFSAPMVRAILDGRKTQTRRVVKQDIYGPGDLEVCPYGKPGDRLWVRETFGFDYTATAIVTVGQAQQTIPTAQTVYSADGHTMSAAGGGWKPSIHMPRWASRILLEVISIKVECLQDISEIDARCEGIPNSEYAVRPDISFKKLWSEINGEKSWDDNPWVWVIEFRRIKP